MKTTEQQLKNVRDDIDDIDYQIHDLLNARATLALKVAKIKMAESGDATDFYRPGRETEILARIKSYNKGPLSADAVANIFKSIMKECLQLQSQ